MAQVNKTYQAEEHAEASGEPNAAYIPIVEMLGLGFEPGGLVRLRLEGEIRAFRLLPKRIDPTIDATRPSVRPPGLKSMADAGSGQVKSRSRPTTVEGALVAVEPELGA